LSDRWPNPPSRPDDIEAVINRVAAAMPAVAWPAAAELRREARAGRRRRVVISTLAAVVALGGVAATIGAVVAPPRPPALHMAGAAQCPNGLVPVNLDLPNIDHIRLSVYNGTARPDLAEKVAADLRMRNFVIIDIDRAPGSYPDVAVIRYGPKAVGAAWVMRAFFLNEADSEFDPSRDGDVVDIVLGDRFLALATRTEVNQSIAVNGRPQPPAGTCAG
jgi:hypothetical protein